MWYVTAVSQHEGQNWQDDTVQKHVGEHADGEDSEDERGAGAPGEEAFVLLRNILIWCNTSMLRHLDFLRLIRRVSSILVVLSELLEFGAEILMWWTVDGSQGIQKNQNLDATSELIAKQAPLVLGKRRYLVNRPSRVANRNILVSSCEASCKTSAFIPSHAGRSSS